MGSEELLIGAVRDPAEWSRAFRESLSARLLSLIGSAEAMVFRRTDRGTYHTHWHLDVPRLVAQYRESIATMLKDLLSADVTVRQALDRTAFVSLNSHMEHVATAVSRALSVGPRLVPTIHFETLKGELQEELKDSLSPRNYSDVVLFAGIINSGNSVRHAIEVLNALGLRVLKVYSLVASEEAISILGPIVDFLHTMELDRCTECGPEISVLSGAEKSGTSAKLTRLQCTPTTYLRVDNRTQGFLAAIATLREICFRKHSGTACDSEPCWVPTHREWDDVHYSFFVPTRGLLQNDEARALVMSHCKSYASTVVEAVRPTLIVGVNYETARNTSSQIVERRRTEALGIATLLRDTIPDRIPVSASVVGSTGIVIPPASYIRGERVLICVPAASTGNTLRMVERYLTESGVREWGLFVLLNRMDPTCDQEFANATDGKFAFAYALRNPFVEREGCARCRFKRVVKYLDEQPLGYRVHSYIRQGLMSSHGSRTDFPPLRSKRFRTLKQVYELHPNYVMLLTAHSAWSYRKDGYKHFSVGDILSSPDNRYTKSLKRYVVKGLFPTGIVSDPAIETDILDYLLHCGSPEQWMRIGVAAMKEGYYRWIPELIRWILGAGDLPPGTAPSLEKALRHGGTFWSYVAFCLYFYIKTGAGPENYFQTVRSSLQDCRSEHNHRCMLKVLNELEEQDRDDDWRDEPLGPLPIDDQAMETAT